MITSKELINKYLEFFKSKGHKVVPSASLIPENDPTVLFTTAGMHPLVPYLLGQRHPAGKRLVGIQKCIRTTDIDEVGDSFHHTFFEMLGNWSLGDYWKEDGIKYSYEFLTKTLKIPKEKISITCFKGDKDAPKDEESAKVWRSLGIKNIAFLGKEDNWWGPAGETGPCGPDTEMFYWIGKGKPKEFDLNKSSLATDGKDWIEIWNDVFMQYNKTKDGKFIPLQQKNVDTGMGVERTLAILNGLDDNYLTDVWKPIIEKIEEISGEKYKDNKRVMRIIADHIKAAVFMLGDGIVPSNTERGYVLRRLIRRAVYYGKKIKTTSISEIAESVFKIYSNYEEIKAKKNKILEELDKEKEKFNITLMNGLEILRNWKKKTISGKEAFLLYQSHGLPIEVTKEAAKERKIDIGSNFDKEIEDERTRHIKISGSHLLGKFKSGLADNSEKTIKLHTATHLLNEALRRVLGKEVKQRGSNITPERLRFDFNFQRKLTDKEIKSVENLVNDKIKENLNVKRSEMELKDALKSGAQSEFGAKYPDIISVYTIGDFSKEICSGPHVKNTGELGHFKIQKEESSSAGVRRIKAVLE